MSSKMCKLAKEELDKKALKQYVKYLKPCKYVCKKCGRAASDESYLCKGVKIKDLQE